MAHPVAELDRVGAVGQGGVHGLFHLRAFVGVDPFQPRLGVVPTSCSSQPTRQSQAGEK